MRKNHGLLVAQLFIDLIVRQLSIPTGAVGVEFPILTKYCIDLKHTKNRYFFLGKSHQIKTTLPLCSCE